MKLIKLSEYVVDVIDKYGTTAEINNCREIAERVEDYTILLTQNLQDRYEINGVSAHQLNRFVPTDLEGNVLEKPNGGAGSCSMAVMNLHTKRVKQYQESLDRVLFEGLVVERNDLGYKYIYSVFIKDNVSKRFLWTIDNKTIFKIINSKAKSIEDLTDLGLTLTKAGEKLIKT